MSVKKTPNLKKTKKNHQLLKMNESNFFGFWLRVAVRLKIMEKSATAPKILKQKFAYISTRV